MDKNDKELIQMAESVHMREYNMPQILDSLILKASSQDARNEIAKIRTRKLEELDRYNYHLEEARAGII